MPRVTPALVWQYLRRFDRDERYFEADEAIAKLVRAFPTSSDLSSVLLKVTTINKLYSTNIMAPFNVAKHIVHCLVDADIQAGAPSAVNKIRHVTIAGVNKNFYSFATKYCSWHNPACYPIYDTFVAKSLRNCSTVGGDLRVYGDLKASVDEFIHRYGLTEFTYKEVDKFLWLFGKDL
jgi:hypothetical protein